MVGYCGLPILIQAAFGLAETWSIRRPTTWKPLVRVIPLTYRISEETKDSGHTRSTTDSGLIEKFCMMWFHTIKFKWVAFRVAKTPTVGWEPMTDSREFPHKWAQSHFWSIAYQFGGATQMREKKALEYRRSTRGPSPSYSRTTSNSKSKAPWQSGSRLQTCPCSSKISVKVHQESASTKPSQVEMVFITNPEAYGVSW